MNTYEALSAASGLAHIKGLDRFDELMPLARAAKLRQACSAHFGFKWVEANFIKYLVHTVALEERTAG